MVITMLMIIIIKGINDIANYLAEFKLTHFYLSTTTTTL
jgi:hypothetical protein